jgi:hypothetical protein
MRKFMGPDWNRGPWSLDSQSLLERTIDRSEVGIEGAAEQIDRGDDRQRNAGCDQTIFNCRCTLFVRPELCEPEFQPDLPLIAFVQVVSRGHPDT